MKPQQRQIHAILYKIVQLETKRVENRFAVAVEIVTESEKSHVFLLHGVGTISFSSVSVTKSTPEDPVNRINATHRKVCGRSCQTLDVKLKTDCEKHDMINAECPDPACYFYRKSLLDSEFTCINFLENPEQAITGLLKTYLECVYAS